MVSKNMVILLYFMLFERKELKVKEMNAISKLLIRAGVHEICH